jgi:hypothetical protein
MPSKNDLRLEIARIERRRADKAHAILRLEGIRKCTFRARCEGRVVARGLKPRPWGMCAPHVTQSETERDDAIRARVAAKFQTAEHRARMSVSAAESWAERKSRKARAA